MEYLHSLIVNTVKQISNSFQSDYNLILDTLNYLKFVVKTAHIPYVL